MTVKTITKEELLKHVKALMTRSKALHQELYEGLYRGPFIDSNLQEDYDRFEKAEGENLAGMRFLAQCSVEKQKEEAEEYAQVARHHKRLSFGFLGPGLVLYVSGMVFMVLGAAFPGVALFLGGLGGFGAALYNVRKSESAQAKAFNADLAQAKAKAVVEAANRWERHITAQKRELINPLTTPERELLAS